MPFPIRPAQTVNTGNMKTQNNPQNNSQKEFYNMKELANLLGVTVRSINGLVREGYFQPLKGIGKNIFPRKQIDDFASKTRPVFPARNPNGCKGKNKPNV